LRIRRFVDGLVSQLAQVATTSILRTIALSASQSATLVPPYLCVPPAFSAIPFRETLVEGNVATELERIERSAMMEMM
jgi:hypothetical protein